MIQRPTRERFIREPLEPGYKIGAKVRCRLPGRYKALVENDIYTVSWVDWPFVIEVEEIPNFTWDMMRFTPWTGEITDAERNKKPGKKKGSGKGFVY